MKLHDALRDSRSLDASDFYSTARLHGVTIGGRCLKPGDRVRIRPRPRGVMNVVLAGKIAVIEGVELDPDGKVRLALMVRDAPGGELGMLRHVGRRFYFRPDEIEPVAEAIVPLA